MTDPAIEYLESRGISEATCLHMGIQYDPRMHAVAFPYYDALGRMQMCRWRRIAPETEDLRYLNSTNVSLRLYNVEDLEVADEVYLCEGEIDTLTVLELGHHAVGVPGAQAFRPAWRWLFADKVVRIAFDPDAGGVSGTARVHAALIGIAEKVEVLHLPKGEDVNSLSMAGTLQSYISRVGEAQVIPIIRPA